MNDLSDPASSLGNNPITQSNTPIQTQGTSPTGNKEIVGGSMNPEGLRDATGQEIELPKEVVSSGVRIQPTVIPIPQPVSSLGVKPSGNNIPVQTTTTVVLPLSDAQIAAGLHASITNSVRWLAEWCVKRLKHLHIAIKNIHGSFVRVTE